MVEEQEDAGAFLWYRFLSANWLFEAAYAAPGDELETTAPARTRIGTAQ